MNPRYLIPISGRPNAGKTSLINYLAHTKRAVGKSAGTTLKITPINFFKDLYLVDLPGYGRITKRSRMREEKIKDGIIQFFDDPANYFLITIHIIDLSTFHLMVQNLEKKGIIPIDIEMIRFIASKANQAPLIALNKIDKIKPDLIEQNVNLLHTYVLPKNETFLMSLKNKEGCRSFKNRINEVIFQKLGVKYQSLK